MGKVKKYQEGGYNPFTGIDTSGATGGFNEFGQGIASMIPGGGAIAGLGQVAGGIADIVGSKKEIERQRRKRQGAKGRRQEARGALDSFEFDVSQAQRDLATAGIRPTDLSPMQGVQATELAALSSDPRALMGGIGASTARANQAIQATQQADLARELGAMSNLAGLEQRALEQKQGLQLGLLQSDRDMAIADQAQAGANIEAARARKRDAFGNIAGGLANVGMAFAGIPGGSAVGNAIAGNAIAGNNSAEKALSNAAGGSTSNLLGMLNSQGGGVDTNPLAGYNLNPNALFFNQKKGGRIKYEEGGKMNEEVMMRILKEQRPVQKTEGEFNHDTNKKAIIDEETGVKEGEATGGEYILNPEQGEAIKVQYDEIARMIEEGSEPSLEELQNLYDAVHEVFSQPQFNEA
jgi:hypothetical protein